MIYPDCDMNKWEYCDNSVILANAEYYYTKEQTEKLIKDISGMTPAEVQEQIDESIKNKADKVEVNELAEQVRQNTQAILDRYTKAQTNDLLKSYLSKMDANKMVANYAKVKDNVVLSLNDEQITIE